MQPAALGAQLQRRNGRRVVQIDVRSAECADRLGEERPLFVANLAHSQALRVDGRFLRDQPLDELLVGHLQREQRDVLLVNLGRVLGRRQAEARLPLPGAPGDDEQVARLHSPEQAVEIDETGRHADRLVAVAGQIVDAIVV